MNDLVGLAKIMVYITEAILIFSKKGGEFMTKFRKRSARYHAEWVRKLVGQYRNKDIDKSTFARLVGYMIDDMYIQHYNSFAVDKVFNKMARLLSRECGLLADWDEKYLKFNYSIYVDGEKIKL